MLEELRLSRFSWRSALPLALCLIRNAGEECVDFYNECLFWSYEGSCTDEGKKQGMRQNCPLSCGVCTRDTCDAASGENASCPVKQTSFDNPLAFAFTFFHNLEDTGTIDVDFVHDERGPVQVATLTPGTSQQMQTFPAHVFQFRDRASQKVIAKIRMQPGTKFIVLDKNFLAAVEGCKDQEPETCAAQARAGACEQTPGHMARHCAESCSMCHLRNPGWRCRRGGIDVPQTPSLQKGSIDRLFQGMQEKWPQYNITFHSKDPWVATFQNFLPDDAIRSLVENIPQLERSSVFGSDQRSEFGTLEKAYSDYRTSLTSWCQGPCESSFGYTVARQRISEVLQVPPENNENLQFLNYTFGQEYKVHHDMDPGDMARMPGPRIFTFFLYLSDVEEGGETELPHLGIKVKPRRGSALLWPHVLSDNPTLQDNRTAHAALPVKKGMKIAANAFVRLFNYKVANLWGCA